MYADEYSRTLGDVTPEQAWAVVERLGGDDRFYAPPGLWRLRGALDAAVGGPGYRITGPGRALERGDEMDFWRVVAVRPPSLLRVKAQTRLPGTAYLVIRVQAAGAGTRLTLRSEFEPAGLAGHAYWWSQLGAHKAVFALMARRLEALVRG